MSEQTKVETYPCPTPLAYMFKLRLLQLHKEGKLAKFLGLRENDKFTPQGVLCDLWGQVTGRGHWGGNQFNYRTPTGGIAHAFNNAPFCTVADFTTPINVKCKVTNFLSNDTSNSPEKYIEFFSKMDKYVVPPIIEPPKSNSKIWEIKGLVMENGLTVGFRIVRITAENIEIAKREFFLTHPKLKFESISFICNTLF